jgi:DNA-binding transcriptional regulator YiaG
MVKVVDVEINIADMKAKAIPTKSGATAWMELAKKERAAHHKAWGYIQKNKFTQNTHEPVRNKQDWNDNPRKREFKRRGTKNPHQLKAIKEMRKNGLSMDAIATELQISEGSVRYWCQTYNIIKGEG